ncbi:hypothetical protein KKC59_01495 [bacterium]|nr:hypothetical protein [bacterium]
MAKKQTFGDKAKKNQKDIKKEYNFFGTKSDMIVKEIKEGDAVVKVIAKDDKGLYVTYPEHVNSGLADPNRFCADRSQFADLEKELKLQEETEKPVTEEEKK